MPHTPTTQEPATTTFMRDPYYTTAFGAVLDQEIADALRAGMALELIYTELAARTRAIADHIVSNHTRHLLTAADGVTS